MFPRQALMLSLLTAFALPACFSQIRVSGVVLHADSRQPMAGVAVSIAGARHPLADALPGKLTDNVAVSTDATGHFALKLRPKGAGWTYACQVAPPPGMLPHLPPVSVVEQVLPNHDSAYQLTFVLAPATAIRLTNPRPGDSVTVSAIHQPTGFVCVAPTVLTAAWMELDPMPATGLLIRWQRGGQPVHEQLLGAGAQGLILE